MQALGQAGKAADNSDMSSPSISPAYQQITNWYHAFLAAQGSKPVPLLITNGAPDEGADQPKETDPSTQLIDISA
jgi:hypothetical protein